MKCLVVSFKVKAFAAALCAPLLSVVFVGPAHANHGYYEFIRQSNDNSTLKWNSTGLNEQILSTHTWRAGSGANQDACDESIPESPVGGWLPTGWYDLWGMYNKKNGNEIDGRAFYLQNKTCSDGTQRTELFIHSEETVDNEQYCPTSGDDPHCWEGDFDFKSAGCIKLKYAHPTNNPNFGISEYHKPYFHDYKGGSPNHGDYTINSFINVHN